MRLTEFERQRRIHGVRPERREVAVHHVRASLQQLVLGVDGLDRTLRIRADLVFDDDHIARLRDRKVRFCGDDQRERLQIRRHVEFAVVATKQHLTEVRRPSVGRNGPHHVREVFRTEPGRRFQPGEVRIDLAEPPFRLDFRAPLRAR